LRGIGSCRSSRTAETTSFFAQILDDEMCILMTVGVWAARYSAPGGAIAGRLADTAAGAALVARNHARDAT
jgi:hypothetical protein